MKPSELLRELNEADEGRRIEAKRSSEIGKSLMETVSAFANTPGLGGGHLLLGVTREQGDLFSQRYVSEGVTNPDKVSADLASQCASMLNERIRPVIEREEVDGRVLMSAYVAEAAPDQKPIYIKSRGLPGGAYLRIGSTDQRCTDRDLERLYKARSVRSSDSTLLPETTERDASAVALANYRRARRDRDPGAPELDLEDTDLLRALRAVRKDDDGVYRFTVAGLLLFGHEEVLRDYFPAARTDYIRVQGRTWSPGIEDRFTSLDLHGPIFETVYRLEAAIMDDLPTRFSLPEGNLHRVDVPLVPRGVIREALVNALMHRDYQVHSPTQIIRYSNRIEFRNAGYSLKPEDELGQPGSELRNPTLAGVLHQTRLAETKGSGIATMRRTMLEADLTPPTFSSSREHNRFVATFLMLHVLEPETLAWLAGLDDLGLSREDRQALVFARETGEIRNEDYRNLNSVDTLVASAGLRRLRDVGLLTAHDKGSATYYTPTDRLLGSPAEKAQPQEEKAQPPGEKARPFAERAGPPGGESHLEEGGIAPGGGHDPDLPRELRERIRALGGWATNSTWRELILDLCRLRPWTADRLAQITGRQPRYLVRSYLTPMVRDGLLVRERPSPHHPNQTYRAADVDRQ